jgi:hypothetical protein
MGKSTTDLIDVKSFKLSAYTDITGGMLQAVEYLNEKNPGRKTILVFSDLREDLRARIPLTERLALRTWGEVAPQRCGDRRIGTKGPAASPPAG